MHINHNAEGEREQERVKTKSSPTTHSRDDFNGACASRWFCWCGKKKKKSTAKKVTITRVFYSDSNVKSDIFFLTWKLFTLWSVLDVYTKKPPKNILVTPPPKKIGTSSCVFVVDKYMKVRIIEESKFHYIGSREKSREKKLSSMFTKKNSHQDCRTLNKKKKDTLFVESPHPNPREKKKALIDTSWRVFDIFKSKNVRIV